MAPQATLVASTPIVEPSASSTTAPANANHKPFVPAMLLVFLGLCLGYTLSYILYRIVMSRRRDSDSPDSPDRGVSQFMNGARLTLNASNNHRPTATPASSNSPIMLDEEKPLTDSQHTSHPEAPMTSPTESSSTPYIVLMPSFTLHPNQEIDQVQLKEQGSTEAQASVPASQAPAPTVQPLSQRIATKVKFLSKDRADAITLDPKLAPVQGPLRPLSMVPSPPRKRRTTLFGLGLIPARGGHSEDPNTDSGTR